MYARVVRAVRARLFHINLAREAQTEKVLNVIVS